MPFGTLPSLRSFLRPLLRSLGMSVEPPYTEEFPKGMTVTDWERTLIALYSSKLGPTHHEHRTNFRITGLRRYKEQSGVQHEYLGNGPGFTRGFPTLLLPNLFSQF